MLHLVLTSGILPALAKASAREAIPACTTHVGILSLRLQKQILSHVRGEHTKDCLEDLMARNPKQIRHAVCFALRVQPESPLETEFVDELLAWAAKRAEANVWRIRQVPISQAKELQFDRMGEYTLHRQEGTNDPNMERATHLMHGRTKLIAPIDSGLLVTKSDWLIAEKWSRTLAVLKHRKTQMSLPVFKLFCDTHPSDFKPCERLTPQKKAAATKASSRNKNKGGGGRRSRRQMAPESSDESDNEQPETDDQERDGHGQDGDAEAAGVPKVEKKASKTGIGASGSGEKQQSKRRMIGPPAARRPAVKTT